MQTQKVIVFDLDFTLWDCGGVWIDCSQPPFVQRERRIVDSRGAYMRLYDDVPRILAYCKENQYHCALASRTTEPDWAKTLLGLLDIDHYFHQQQIFPGSKVAHFKALKKAFGCEYQDMLFFDDEMRNIEEVSRLGVTAVHVPEGLNWTLFRESLI
ncbi:magnesium-dependent phosphatase-1 [Alteromonas gilva]|uniref:Magnesium-dependent phosphatase-1 n=1 Tax=Alteromonas gilva TaxID=2987522 RepID=A0ABT5L3Q8_9ALTE|nr:magnesium-dependent phosphatase-1 [Alteromonas gilva]MDC8831069.1 magnesium-dependent phosphatase-1 [Alteromonas gilva]